jgi:hypothetical protein
MEALVTLVDALRSLATNGAIARSDT